VVLYFRCRRATDDNMAHVPCGWIHKTANTHSQYVTRIAVPQQYGCRIAPRFYVVPTLPVLSI